MFAIQRQHRTLAAVISLLLIAAGSYSIYRHIRSRGHTGTVGGEVNAIIGATAAEEITKLLGTSGKIIIITLDTSRSPMPPIEEQVAGFRQALATRGQFTVLTTEKLEPNPSLMDPGQYGLPADWFDGCLKKHPEADAIVSFVGAPKFTAQDIARRRVDLPRIVAVWGMGVLGPNLRALFASDIVQAGILPSPTPKPILDTRTRTPREWYEMVFMVATPQTAAILPE